jgi:ribokinase
MHMTTPPRATVVGSLVIDLTLHVPSWPRPGEVVPATSMATYRGGKGYNQAVALARLGACVAMFGAVGADEYGEQIAAALTREGVDAGGLTRLRDVPTTLAVPLVLPDGDVGFVQAPGASRYYTPDLLPPLQPCDLVLLQGEAPLATSLAAARQARQLGAMVFLNPAPAHDVTPELAQAADVICPNEIEARALLGLSHDGVEDPEQLALALAGARTAVITLGARGAAWARGTEHGLVRPPRVVARDATGAGDSFCAALALALHEGQLLPRAVRFACAAGAHAATVLGAEPGLPTRAQVEALLGAAP